jgi:3-hydroxyacyl-[acyl-carrier-protein] dehydratase
MRFLLVDHIVELVPGERVLARRRIPDNEELFQDHFAGFPVMPGVLLVEMMGQAVAKCLDAQKLLRGKALLAKILSASFRDWVRPGAETTLVGQVVANDARFATAECRLEVGGRSVAQCKLMFTFMPVEKFAPGFRDEQLEAWLAAQADKQAGRST